MCSQNGICWCNISGGYECAESNSAIMSELGSQVVHICRGGGHCVASSLSNMENDYHDVELDIVVTFPASEQTPDSSGVVILAMRATLAKISVVEIENVEFLNNEMSRNSNGGRTFRSRAKIRVEGETHASQVQTSVTNSMHTQAVR